MQKAHSGTPKNAAVVAVGEGEGFSGTTCALSGITGIAAPSAGVSRFPAGRRKNHNWPALGRHRARSWRYTGFRWLEQEWHNLDRGLRQTLRRSPVWREKDDLLRTAPGVGEQLSLTRLAYVPDLVPLDRRQIADRVSVAPFSRNSGTLRGRRTMWGGRARARAALYMGALVATCYDPVIQVFYQRLLGSGKAKKVALAACMRKLLVTLNAMVKTGQAWHSPSATP